MKIICLCGSTKFKEEYREVEARETLKGNIVLTCGLFGHADGIPLSEKDKERLDDLHLMKIGLADEVIVINVGGYFGESTKRELLYARRARKPVSFEYD